ncbi:MAG: acetyl-CoA C-acyltransferase [Nocardioidaceae bacterium]
MSEQEAVPGPRTSVIVAGARTPFGRLSGSLQHLAGSDLGAVAIGAALERAGVGPDEVGYVVMGQVLTAGAGQLPARQAAFAAGIPLEVPALTVNKVCLSGMEAIVLADQLVRAGDLDVVVAGGQESMSRAPRLLVQVLQDGRPGPAKMRDHATRDGLWDSFTDQTMGSLTEVTNAGDRWVSRADQDAFAARSHERARRAQREGLFDAEVVPAPVVEADGSPGSLSRDELPSDDATPEVLAGLAPAYRSDGTITSGSASASSDGACAVVVMAKAEAERRGLPWLAEIVGAGEVGGPDSTLQDQPANAIRAACARARVRPEDLDLVEINEAFAVVPLVSARRLGLDPERVNVNGGALALGHPIGVSGARITLHLALELARRGGGVGAAALCGGGGQGEAVVLRVPGPNDRASASASPASVPSPTQAT